MSRPARVAVELAGSRARVTALDASQYLGPRLIAVDRCRARVALVGVSATLLAGDDLRLDVDVGAGTHLELVEPAGTIAYDARGGHADWAASVRVAAGGSLVWAGAPFVVADGADVHRHTAVDLERGASMLLRETVVLGRSGEHGGPLRTTLSVVHDGRPLLLEDVDVRDPGLRAAPGILGTARVLATVALLGAAPEATTGHETRLAGPGALVRALAADAHVAESLLAGSWERWRGCVGGDDSPRPAATLEPWVTPCT